MNWQDLLLQYGQDAGSMLGYATRKGGIAGTLPHRGPVSSEPMDPTIGAGMDTPGLAAGGLGNTENMSVNKPGAYTPTGEGMMSTGAASPTEGLPGAQPTGGAGVPWGSVIDAALNLYGIAKSGSPNDMRSQFAEQYGMKDSSDLPSAPATASRAHQAAHMLGSTALNFAPGVGPIVAPVAGALGDLKSQSDYGEWYHKLMAANPQVSKPKMETPDVKMSSKQKVLKGIQAVGGAAASYWGGPVATLGAGILHGASDKHFEEQRQAKAKRIALTNQRLAENRANTARDLSVRDQAVANAQGGQGDQDQGPPMDPTTQALMMLLGGGMS